MAARLMRVVSIVVSIAVFLLLAGKLVWLPVALVGPSGWGSPAYLGVASYLPVSGEVSLYCVDPLRTACVVSEEEALGSRCYELLVEVPGVLWLAIVALGVASSTLTAAFWPSRGVALLASPVLALLVLNAAAVGSLYVDQSRLEYRYPEVGLGDMVLDTGAGRLKLDLELAGYRLQSASCSLEGYGVVETQVEGDVVVARVPAEYMEHLYRVRSAQRPFLPPTPPVSVYETITASCSIILDVGRIEGRYVASFAWRELEARGEGSVLGIVNANPVAFEARVDVVDRAAGALVWRQLVQIAPASAEAIDFSRVLPPGVYEARVVYVFLGSERSQVVSIVVG